MTIRLDPGQNKPRLPRVPQLPHRLSSGISDDGKEFFVPSSRVRSDESSEILRLSDDRDAGRPLFVPKDGTIARVHGCRLCPYYASSFCFEGVFPPHVHPDGICQSRLNELLDTAGLVRSSDGLFIRKSEAIERIRRYIVLLETNLADYHSKRVELSRSELKKLESSVDIEKAYSGKDSLSSEKLASLEQEFNTAQLQALAFDDYELGLQKQIQFLSLKYGEFLQADIKQSSDNLGKVLGFVSVTEAIEAARDAERKLLKSEARKVIDEKPVEEKEDVS